MKTFAIGADWEVLFFGRTHFRFFHHFCRLQFLAVIAYVLVAGLSTSANTNCVPVPDGVVAWWPAEGNALDLVGTNNGTLTNGATFLPGESGQAFYFNGLNQYAIVPDAPSLDPTNGLTIEAWVYPLVPADNPLTLVAKDGVTTNRQYLLNIVSLPQGQSVFRVHVGTQSGFVTLTGNQVVSLNTWTHVALCYDGTFLQLYVNGALDTNTLAPGPLVATAQSLLLGSSVDGFPFVGRIDEVTLYNRSLSPTEINGIYQAGSAGKCVGNSAPFIFLQPTNQTIYEGSNAIFSVVCGGTPPLTFQWVHGNANLPAANGSTLVISNAQFSQAGDYAVVIANGFGSVTSAPASLTVNAPPGCTPLPTGLVSWWSADGTAADVYGTNSGTLINGAGFAPGLAGNAFLLTNSQYVQIPNSDSLNPSRGLTLECWVFPFGNGAPMTIVSKEYGGDRQYLLNLVPGANGQMVCRPHVGLPSGLIFIDGTRPVPTNAWTHVAMCYDGTALKLYVNGTLDVATSAQGLINPLPPDLLIGVGGQGSYPFVGLIDEVSLYRRPLFSQEILSIYNSGISAKCQGSTLPYVFQQPTNQVAYIGHSVTFSTIAGGTQPLIYQWTFNSIDISGAVQNSLTLTNVQSAQAGVYALKVSNALGTTNSSSVTLTVAPAPPCLITPSGVVSTWLAEGDAVDQVSGNNGTLPPGAGFAPGYAGQAFTLDGSAVGISVGNATALRLQNFTIEGWVKRSSAGAISGSGTLGFIFSYGQDGYGLAIGNDGTLVLTQVGDNSVSSPSLVNDTSFHHVAVTKDASTVVFYLDGKSYPVGPYNPVFSFTTSAAIGAIGQTSGDGFLGEIDELSIYSRALSITEIQTLYGLGYLGKCPPVVPPSIVQQPTNQSAYLTQSASFSVMASGSGVLSYQWFFNGSSIVGATQSALLLTNLQFSQAGTYSVTVSNLFGAATSSNALLTVSPVPPCSPTAPNLVSWWRADQTLADAVGANDGHFIGNTTFGPGLVGNAFQFDGSSSGVVVGNPSNLQLQNFSIEAWVKRGNLSNISLSGPLGFIFGYGLGGYGFAIGNDGSLLLTAVGTTSVASPAGLIKDTNFHHVAVTKSGGVVIFYVDSVPYQASAPYDPDFVFTTSAALGTISDTGPDVFLGAIDELAIYSRALSPGEINSIYAVALGGKCVGNSPPFIVEQPDSQTVIVGRTAVFSVATSGSRPISYQWSFNGNDLPGETQNVLTLSNAQPSQAGTYFVTVSNSFGLTVSSNATLTVTPPPVCLNPPAGLVSWWRAEGTTADQVSGNSGSLTDAVSYASAEVGHGFVFSGTSLSFSVGNPANLQLQDFTIEAWVARGSPSNTSLSANTGLIFGFGTYGYAFGIRSDGALALVRTDDIGVYSERLVTDTNLHHVAVSKSGTTINFYVDGVQHPAPDFNVRFWFTKGASVGGADMPGNWGFLGTIDELSIYSRVLTSEEIQSIYRADMAGKCVGPTAPFIITQTGDENVYAGSSVSLSAVAAGNPPLSYQWTFNGTGMQGATQSVLNLVNVQTNQTGTYSLIVSNSAGLISSTNVLVSIVPPPPCMTPPPGLVSYWPAEGNGLDVIGGNSGILTRSTSFAPGVFGQAFNLDGSYGIPLGEPPYSQVHSNLNLQNFTVEAWIKRASLTEVSGANGAGGWDFIFSSGFLSYAFGIKPDGSLVLTKATIDPVEGVDTMFSPPLIIDTNFHHVAVTKQETNANFYVDGNQYPIPPYEAVFDFGYGGAAIGMIDASLSDRSFLGAIDELSIYSRALSTNEIQSLYTLGFRGKCQAQLPPSIFVQPSNRTSNVGDSGVIMNAEVTGTPPFSYQWLFNGVPIPWATAPGIPWTNVQPSTAGSYNLIVTNDYGSITSAVAVLSVIYGSATVSLPNTNAYLGQLVGLPLTLQGNGDENILSFSLSFDPQLLSYSQVTLLPPAAAAALLINTNQISAGLLGIALALPPGTSFSFGTQQVLLTEFTPRSQSNSIPTSISFFDSPTPRQVLGLQGQALPANFVGGTITITVNGLEGDLSPRPSGDGVLSISDWALAGQYAARLASPSTSSEFQRADCAPRSTFGDGVITVSDWVQLGRYVLGLDPIASAGGPDSELPYVNSGLSSTRILTVSTTPLTPNKDAVITLSFAAQGNENALGLSLTFDPAKVNVTSVLPGACASQATLYVNTNQAAAGKLGLVLALNPGSSFPAGNCDVVQVTFRAAPSASGTFQPAFSDSPVIREVCDVNALALPASFIVNSNPGNTSPLLKVGLSKGNISISWPAAATNFVLQETVAGLSTQTLWTNSSAIPSTTNSERFVTFPVGPSTKYYRLQSH